MTPCEGKRHERAIVVVVVPGVMMKSLGVKSPANLRATFSLVSVRVPSVPPEFSVKWR